MKYAYYPGCSAESTARDFHMSILEVANALDIKLTEIKGWTCCGSTPAHHTDKLLSISLPAANLLKAQEMGMDMVVSCAACFNRMKVANHEITTNPSIKKQLALFLPAFCSAILMIEEEWGHPDIYSSPSGQIVYQLQDRECPFE